MKKQLILEKTYEEILTSVIINMIKTGTSFSGIWKDVFNFY